jgi:predicted ABC-type ATPase
LKDIFIIGGPNGAGKTTAAKRLLPDVLGTSEFVNADEIARGLSPFNGDQAAIAAGRAMLQRMSDLVRLEQSFAFETTCSGKSHLRLLEVCKKSGWRLTLIFLWLSSAEMAVERVAQRVRAGGHNIPRDVIHRRYAAGVRNMNAVSAPRRPSRDL